MITKNKAVRILFTGFCINLAIGILYAWSVFKSSLVEEQGWSNADATLPYTVAIVVFALSLLVAGVLQDKIGPRKVLITGTFLVGLGMLLSGLVSSVWSLVFTFGVITGTGIGFGYACLSPASMKWFHPSRKGFVNGVITAGFGLGAVYLAPLTTALISGFGIANSFMILGAMVILVATPLACTITNPPEGYEPQQPKGKTPEAQAATQAPAAQTAMNWREMVKTRQFYTMWIMFAFASSAGLMVIGNITSIALEQAQLTNAAYLVSVVAVFNCLGRLGGGVISDKIGGVNTLMIAFIIQGANMLAFMQYNTESMLVLGAVAAGVGYGMLLSVFPTLTAEFYGLKNYGANYGVLYTAWGVSGFIGPVVAAMAIDGYGNYSSAYLSCAVMLGISLLLALMTKPVRKNFSTPDVPPTVALS